MRVDAVVDAGDDNLIVRGTSDTGEEVHAFGWVSAITNHTDDNVDYREMTKEEKMTYYITLLNEQNPPAPILKNLL